MNDENDTQSGGFLDRIKESPRTVSALIIILIVAAAIYAFSGEPQQPVNEELTGNEAATTDIGDEQTDETEVDEAVAPTIAPPGAPGAPVAEPIPQQRLQEMRQGLPAAERQGDAFVEKAQAGDGITHLARRATTRWLADNAAGYEITNEHRIYIEDYIQNRIGSEGLSIDETKTISFALIAEAVEHAGQLNDQQLRNLSHYTTVLQ